MRLYLVRHCDAVHPIEDPARPLSEHGREQARRLAAFMPRTVGVVDEIVHSGVLRAQETAEFLAAAVRPEGGVRHLGGLTPGDSPRAAASELRHYEGARVVVTHLPLVAHVAGLLLGMDEGRDPLVFRTGTMAAFSGDDRRLSLDWMVHADLLPPRGGAPESAPRENG